MSQGTAGTYHIKLLGAFRLTAPDGQRVHVRSRKGIALLALLATADHGERTRSWLQEKLWGSRGLQQAQYSLRRELSELRTLLNSAGGDVLASDSHSVHLNLDRVQIDVRDASSVERGGEFLEGIDLPGENAFEDWLREMRAELRDRPLRRSPDGPALAHVSSARGATSPRDATFILALALKPMKLAAQAPPEVMSLLYEALRLLTKHLSARKWLPLFVTAATDEVASVDDASQGHLLGQSPRYILETEFTNGSHRRLVLQLKNYPGPRLVWMETLHILETVAGNELDDRVGRLSSVLNSEIFYAESRRIQALPADQLSAADLTHLARQNLGQVSLEMVETARSYLDQAAALEPCTSERTILRCYVEGMAIMGAEDASPDAAQLRKHASLAINADPTDWRGPLLASMVELWLGNAELATAHARRAKSLCTYNAAAIGQLGVSYLWNGEPESAISELDLALSLSMLERRPYLVLCNMALAKLLTGQLGEALALCDQAASCIPELGLAHLLKIEILVRLNRHFHAARTFDESIRGNFDDLIGIVRRQRVMPPFHIPVAAAALAKAIEAAEQLREVPGAQSMASASH